jgi:hypothetical protein
MLTGFRRSHVDDVKKISQCQALLLSGWRKARESYPRPRLTDEKNSTE